MRRSQSAATTDRWRALFSWFFVSHNAAPQAFCAPNTRAQTFQLHDLAVIDKKIHVCAVVFDIPREHVGIGGFEHQFFHSDLVYESRWDIGPPRVDILGDAFALDHDNLSAGIKESLRLRNSPIRIPRSFGLKLCSRRATARAELNTNFGLRFHSRFAHQIN